MRTTMSDGSSLPALPAPLPITPGAPNPIEPISPLDPIVIPPIRVLRAGCYLLNYRLTPRLPGAPVIFDGTLRVESNQSGRTASGDLYQRPAFWIPWPPFDPRPPVGPFPPIKRGQWILAPGPDPADGIPIFPRDRYRFYMCVTQILEAPITLGRSFTLGFDLYRYDRRSATWTNAGAYTAEMFWKTAPAGYPIPGQYLAGEVKNSSGVVTGELTMGWISSFLRKAEVELDGVQDVNIPLDNGSDVTWHSVFAAVGWDMTAISSNTSVAEPSGSSWNSAECHQGMLQWRDKVDLDRQWRYHLLCVQRLDETSRGYMYDDGGTNSNNIPREGAAIAGHWRFGQSPATDPEGIDWGGCAGQPFDACPAPYLRTAVHEIGHAILLFHPQLYGGNHIMEVTPSIAAHATAQQPFPGNILWQFSDRDAYLLRHLPDEAVRPGGSITFSAAWPSYPGIPLSPPDYAEAVPGLVLSVEPVLETVPLGAPVRVDLTLANHGAGPVPVPSSLSMTSGQVRGRVIDPSGVARPFSTIIRYLDIVPLRMLNPDETMHHSLTLIGSSDGALFPVAGTYRVIVEVEWALDGTPVRVTGETSTLVSPVVDAAHAEVAQKLLATPDTLLVMVFGGDHLTEGVEAIQAALDNPVLRPHFAFIEGKRLAKHFGARRADLVAATELIGDSQTVMSQAEMAKAAKLVGVAQVDGKDGRHLYEAVNHKTRKHNGKRKAEELTSTQ